jgi:hypothetical protein
MPFALLPLLAYLTHVTVLGGTDQRDTAKTLYSELLHCAKALPDHAPENATLAVASLFLNYSAVDNETKIQAEIAASTAAFYHRTTPNADDKAYAQRLPAVELNHTVILLQNAIVECKRVKAGGYRRASQPHPQGKIKVNSSTGFFNSKDGVPFFPTGYNQGPLLTPDNVERSLPLGMTFMDAYFTPGMILLNNGSASEEKVNNLVKLVDKQYASGAYVEMFLGNGKAGTSHAFPQWAQEKYPDLSNVGSGQTHFYSYDIDHPAAKLLIGTIIDAIATAVAGHPAVLGWSLANEPGFRSANSTYTFAKFQGFLADRYNTSIADLNQAWHRNYTSFDDPAIAKAMGGWASNARTTLDWESFNNQRVTAWYSWLCDRINTRTFEALKTHNSTRWWRTDITDVRSGPSSLASHLSAACFIKASNSASGLHPNDHSPSGPDGIDRLALSSVLHFRGADTRILPTGKTHVVLPSFPQQIYAIDWVTAAAGTNEPSLLDISQQSTQRRQQQHYIRSPVNNTIYTPYTHYTQPRQQP